MLAGHTTQAACRWAELAVHIVHVRQLGHEACLRADCLACKRQELAPASVRSILCLSRGALTSLISQPAAGVLADHAAQDAPRGAEDASAMLAAGVALQEACKCASETDARLMRMK